MLLLTMDDQGPPSLLMNVSKSMSISTEYFANRSAIFTP
jgi:hypothetical protein